MLTAQTAGPNQQQQNQLQEMAMAQNCSFGVVTPNATGKDGQRDPQFSTPLASHKFTSFQSYRAGADLTKSMENLNHI